MEHIRQTTPEAIIDTIRHEDGRMVIIPIATELLAESGPVAKQVADLAATVGTFGQHGVALTQRLMPGAPRDQEITAAAERMLPRQFVDVANATRAEDAAIRAATARIDAVRVGDPSLHAQVRDRVAKMSRADQAQFALAATLDQTSAITAGDAFTSGLPDEIYEMVVRRHRVLAHVHATGLQADHQHQPDASDPIGGGPNVEAAFAASEKALQAHEARSGTVEAARNTLRSIVDAVALACDISRDQAYRLLTTKPAK